VSVLDELERAVNIGPKLARDLRAVGVRDLAGLRRMGARAAWARLCASRPFWRHRLALYALEGAIRDVRWRKIGAGELAGLAAGYEDVPLTPVVEQDMDQARANGRTGGMATLARYGRGHYGGLAGRSGPTLVLRGGAGAGASPNNREP
jgi:DNA transformation protein